MSHLRKMKDEGAGRTIAEYIRFRPKKHSIQTKGVKKTYDIEKAKGVKENVV